MDESIQPPFISELYFCSHCDLLVSLIPNTPLICPECSEGGLEMDSSTNSFSTEDQETDSSSDSEYEPIHSESILGGHDSFYHSSMTGFEEEDQSDRVLPTILERHPSYSPISLFSYLFNDIMYSPLRENIDNIITALLEENNELGSYESPLSKEQIELLPILVLSQDHLNKDSQCAICLEEFIVGEKAKHLPCDHFYHENCIVTWLEKRSTCPNCRKKI